MKKLTKKQTKKAYEDTVQALVEHQEPYKKSNTSEKHADHSEVNAAIIFPDPLSKNCNTSNKHANTVGKEL